MDASIFFAGLAGAASAIAWFTIELQHKRIDRMKTALKDASDALDDANNHLVQCGATFRHLTEVSREMTAINARAWDYVKVLQDILKQHKAHYPELPPVDISAIPACEALLRSRIDAVQGGASSPPTQPKT